MLQILITPLVTETSIVVVTRFKAWHRNSLRRTRRLKHELVSAGNNAGINSDAGVRRKKKKKSRDVPLKTKTDRRS